MLIGWLRRRKLTVAAALVFLLLAGAAWWVTTDNVKPLVDKLRGKDRSVRTAAADKLAALTDERDIRRVIFYLGDPNPVVRAEVARVLVRIGAPAATPLAQEGAKSFMGFRSWTHQNDTFRKYFPSYAERPFRVVQGAQYALTRIGKPAAVPLARLLSDKNIYIRQFAIQALPPVYDPSIDAALIDALKEPALRMTAAVLLGAHRCRAAADPLAALITGAGQPEDIAVTCALARLDDPRAVPPLIDLLGHKYPPIRYAAVRSIGALPGPQALQATIGALGDAYPMVRQCAAIMLWRRGDAGAVAALHIAASDTDRRVSLAAQAALAYLEGNPAGPAYDDVDSHPADDPDENPPAAASPDELRQVAEATALFRKGGAELNAAREMLSPLRSREATAALVELTDDDNPDIREQAAFELYGRWDPAASAALVRLLDDPDYIVRANVEPLVRLPLPGVEEALIRVFSAGCDQAAFSLGYVGGRPSVDALEAYFTGRFVSGIAQTLSDIDYRAAKAALDAVKAGERQAQEASPSAGSEPNGK